MTNDPEVKRILDAAAQRILDEWVKTGIDPRDGVKRPPPYRLTIRVVSSR